MSHSLNQATVALFDLQPSKQLLLLFILLAFASSSCVVFCIIPIMVKIALLVFITVVFIHTIRKHALRNTANAVVGLRQLDNQSWLLTFYNGQQIEAVLSGQSVVNANSALLLFNRMSDQTISSWLSHSIVITSDSVSKMQLRSLKACLLAVQFVQ